MGEKINLPYPLAENIYSASFLKEIYVFILVFGRIFFTYLSQKQTKSTRKRKTTSKVTLKPRNSMLRISLVSINMLTGRMTDTKYNVGS